MRQSAAAVTGVVFAALLALAGLAASAVLLQRHVAVEVGSDPVLGAMCEDAEGQSSCDAILASKWGKIVLGRGDKSVTIPTAMFGFAFFACMASWYITVGQARGSRRWLHFLPVLGAAVGAVICIWLDVIMWSRFDRPCWLCFLVHVLTLALLLVTLLLWPRQGMAAGPAVAPAGHIVESSYGRQSELSHPPLHLVLAAVLTAAAMSAAGWGIYQSRLRKAYSNEYFAKWQEYDGDYAAKHAKFMSQPQLQIPIMPEDPVRGPADAPHTVVVFTDFQCPHCRLIADMLDERMKEYPGRFRVVFKYFPMNTTCNIYIKNTPHGAACAAAVTAEAARILGGNETFWKMHDELFRDPEGFAKRSTEYVKQACEKLGIDHDALWKQIKTYGIWDRIRSNVGQGSALGVNATPTLFFDGRRMAGWGDRHTWRFLVESPPSKTPHAVPATYPVLGTRPASTAPSVPVTTTRAAAAPPTTRAATAPAM
ncbi:MAG TPA: vitamin K epoxide reductase family protein [Phycisphaerae bacterium]|nr:vitamin K epoxide reductase family protein [Phycisphaerae bacterium]HRR87097.1 vitamin K epoxide reductase family protein [Phycisphaerae bacterium]